MSKVAERGWKIEAKRRRQMYLQRIRNVTEAHLVQNRERLDRLRSQGLDIHVFDEYSTCRTLLERVEGLLSGDPERARDENVRLSAMMRSIDARARENLRAAQAAERVAEEAAQEAKRDAARERLAAERDANAEKNSQEQAARVELLDMIRKARQSLPGAIERDLCQGDLAALRQEIERRTIRLEEVEQSRRDLKHRLDLATERARTTAHDLQLADQRDEERRQMSDALEEALALYVKLKDENAQAAIRNLRSRHAGELVSMQALNESLASIRQAADDRAVREEARREAVSGLLRELGNAGFVVSQPKLEDGELSAVLIKARRPSGAQAAFRVSLDGMTYKFDHYEGQACLDDADKVFIRLQDIYGIELEEEKVSWQNPDMIGKSERRLPDSREHRTK